MDPSEDVENLNHRVDAVALNDEPDHDSYTGQKELTATDILRIKQQMSNQCFEMAVELNREMNRSSYDGSEAERDLPDYVSEVERVKTLYFNSTITLHRIQIWHAIEEKLQQNDPMADALKAVSGRCLSLCSQIKELQQESRVLSDEITEMQKKRLEMKRLMHEKMKEIDDLMKTAHPNTEQYKAVLEKGLSNLEKHKKIAVMIQNVLRGMILACKINWMDDPKLGDIAMSLEELPISD